MFINKGLELDEILQRFHHPWNQRDTRLDREFAALGLGTHQPDRSRRRSNPRQTLVFNPLGEFGVLGEESVPGMNEPGSAGLGDFENPIDAEIALRGSGRPDAKGLIGHENVR